MTAPHPLRSEVRNGASDELGRGERRTGNHSESPVFELLELHLVRLCLWQTLGEAKRVEPERARRARAAARLPKLLGERAALDDGDAEEDLRRAARVLRRERVRGLEPVGLGERRAWQVRPKRLEGRAEERQHGDAAVLHLRLAQPLERRVGSRARARRERVQLGEAQRVPRLAAELNRRTGQVAERHVRDRARRSAHSGPREGECGGREREHGQRNRTN
mmetsp:Transcript_21314/g.66139  ORF Transcript_21314/g.66139 Transcript_21314/m.66139 type:complete len:220 (+) Transcript_21314:556-1215(+)